jgi:type IV pilus assembly protein PilE
MTFRRPRGFTLIELMVVVAAIAILASVAYPSYRSQITKGRRADGKQALMELAQKMERFYTERGTYAGATLGSTGIYGAVSPGGYYNLAIVTQTADAFSITATPTSAQSDDACATLGYNQLGEQTVSSGATLSAAKCW